MNINSNVATIISLILAIVVIGATSFAPQLGAQWVDFILKACFAITAGLHIPVINTTVSSIFTKKPTV
jgi:hypothetical protein